MNERLHAYLALIRFEKPVGTLLLLWPAMWGLLMATAGLPQLHNVIIFVLGTFFMRSAGCAINDYADRNIDGLVARTSQRPLAQGLIHPWEALILAVVFALLSFGLVLFTNTLTVILSFGAVMFAGFYPFTKRWIQSPQVILGIAFAWAIPMGFAAELQEVPLFAWLFFGICVLWIISYDTYYALADREDDQFLNIGSTALLLKGYAEIVSFVLNLVFLALFLFLYWLFISDRVVDMLIMSIGIGFAMCCAGYQYKLACSRDAEQCIKAFKLNNISGLVVTLSLLVTKM